MWQEITRWHVIITVCHKVNIVNSTFGLIGYLVMIPENSIK